MSAEWVFDPQPPSGKRSGGNAAESSFSGHVDTLVREVIQNSLDAKRPDVTTVDVRLRLIELDGHDFDSFMEAISWETISDNLKAVPKDRGGKAIQEAASKIEVEQKIQLLVVEDRGTKGLAGAETRINDEEKNSFCALVKDELYSDKDDADAAGSYGLGKSLLWAFSSVKTVLFSSIPVAPPGVHEGLRFIGRASLPFHETNDDGACTGDGWLGIRRGDGSHDRWAESVWGEEALGLARKCLCSRDENDFGLSEVIVGLKEPVDEDRDLYDIALAIHEAGIDSFWPAIVQGQVRIEVTVEKNGEILERLPVDPHDGTGYSPVVDLFEKFKTGALSEVDILNNPGDQGLKWINLRVPRRHYDPEHESFTGRVPILVRLLKEDERSAESILDRVFRFRRQGMVIRQSTVRNLSIAARPYVAVVPAGSAAGDLDEFKKIERFLRSSEPPEHDQWTYDTRKIKQNYVQGAKTYLFEFENAIKTAIRELVAIPEKKGGQLPRAILKHLKFGDTGGGGNKQFLSVSSEKAWIKEGNWHFSASCRRVQEDASNWHIRVKLNYLVDGGGADDAHAIESVSAPGALRTAVIHGIGYIEFPPDMTERVEVTGLTRSDSLPVAGLRAAIKLRVDGFEGGMPNA